MKRLLILLPILFVSCPFYFGIVGEFDNFQVQKNGNELIFSWDQLDFAEYGKEWSRYAQEAEEKQDVAFVIYSTASGRYLLEKNVGKKTAVTVPVDDMEPGKYIAGLNYIYLSGYKPSSAQYISEIWFTLDEHKEIAIVSPDSY